MNIPTIGVAACGSTIVAGLFLFGAQDPVSAQEGPLNNAAQAVLVKSSARAEPKKCLDNFLEFTTEDKKCHNLKGWYKKGYMTLRAEQSVDLRISIPGLDHKLGLNHFDGKCDDSFELYIKGERVFTYDGSGKPNRWIMELIQIPGHHIKDDIVTFTFKNTAKDDCGRAPIDMMGIHKVWPSKDKTPKINEKKQVAKKKTIEGILKTECQITETMPASITLGWWPEGLSFDHGIVYVSCQHPSKQFTFIYPYSRMLKRGIVDIEYKPLKDGKISSVELVEEYFRLYRGAKGLTKNINKNHEHLQIESFDVHADGIITAINYKE